VTESPFQTVNKVLAETPNHCDLLRIIASEASLKPDDKQSLREAADQLEFAQRDLIAVYAKLIETQQHLIAVNDQLIAEKKQKLAKWSYSSGPMKVQQL